MEENWVQSLGWGDPLEGYSPCAVCLVALSCLTLQPPWTVAHQAPQSMGFSSQEWVAISFSGDLPDPGIEFEFSPLAGRLFTTKAPEK